MARSADGDLGNEGEMILRGRVRDGPLVTWGQNLEGQPVLRYQPSFKIVMEKWPSYR